MTLLNYAYLSPHQITATLVPAAIEPPRQFTALRRDMGDYLPLYYRGSKTVNNVLDRGGSELAALNADIADVLAQFFVDTATWGLANWERICAIPTDESKPADQRRSAIKARLRGTGTVTVALIKNVAESFNNGAVEVTENTATYTVNIRYVSSVGTPANIADIEAALREIIPAHLAITYEFLYVFINEIDGVMTLNTLATTQLNKFAPFV